MKALRLVMFATALIATPLAAQPCITDTEAQAFASVALPEIIRQTGRVCAVKLPATSLVRREGSAFLGRYDAEADRAWPAARAAIVKLSDPAIDALLDSSFARPLMTSLLVPQLVGRIAVDDCPVIDRLVTLTEPLPARNTAGIVVTVLQYLRAEQAKGRNVAVPALPLCALGTR